MDDFKDLVRLILQQSVTIEKSLKPDDTLRLHKRVRMQYAQYVTAHPQKLIEINEINILKYSEFEGFIVALIKNLQNLGYFRTFHELLKDLHGAKGLFPLKTGNTFDSKDLYLEFIFKNQRGVHADDLDKIFKILEVETYYSAITKRGFTMLPTENDSKLL